MWKMLPRAYQYLFYRSYAHQLKRWNGDEKMAVVGACALIAIAVVINIYTILRFGFLLIGEHLPSSLSVNGLPHVQLTIIGAIAAIVLVQVMYSLYVRNSRYKEIVQEFSSEDPIDKRRHTKYIYIYVVITIVFYITSAILGAHIPVPVR